MDSNDDEKRRKAVVKGIERRKNASMMGDHGDGGFNF